MRYYLNCIRGEFCIWKEKYKELSKSEIKIITDEIDLYDLFLMSDIQIGVYSTALYEGLAFQLYTLIYNIPEASIFKELCEKGYTKYINNANEIIKNLKQFNTYNKDINNKLFWKNDSINNILKEIKN